MKSDSTKILVVEDEPCTRDLLVEYLDSEGYTCRSAADGNTALELMEKESFQLVVTDILMPGMSGMDLLNIIRTLYPETAVLMVTSVNDRETGVLSVELGAYGYVIKPFDRNEILINVAGALERRRLALFGQERTGSGAPHVQVINGEPEPIEISAREAVECVRSGMGDASIMVKFNLSAKALHSVFDQLVRAGCLTRSEIDRRISTDPGTVELDLDVSWTRLPGTPSREKPLINAADAVKCLKSGMDDSALMKRYKLSAKGLRSLFGKLVAKGVIDQSELDKRMSETHDWAVLKEDS